ncbi:MAG: S1C family serine protease [Gammaproteobacteria bacterium]|nr:S1C family serine protease [Gammaproteobacteria bacterium]
MIQADCNRKTHSTGRGEGRAAWFVAAGLVAIFSISTANAQVIGQPASAVTEQLFESVNGSVCTIVAIAQDGTPVNRGSGFVLSGSGLLVTNAHVLAGLQTATAKCGGRQLDIRRIVKFDRDVDLVVGEIGPANIPGLTLSTGTDIRPGKQIYVFGSPHGLEGTITPGLASGQRIIEGRSYLQISAPISAGSSGGPVTDEHGAVLGVAVASLDIAQNINFAIPAAAIMKLPDVDMNTAELAAERSGVSTVPVVEAPSVPKRRVVTAGTAAFRGNTFGSPCGDVAAAEYQRKRPLGGGTWRFNKWYGGTLEMDVDLLGAPATVFYDCDKRFGMTRGRYRIRGHADAVDRITRVLRSKYGSGVVRPIAEVDAKQRGCLWNKSLPGSRFYRPSEWTSWRIDDRFHVDLLVCGGASTLTYLFYSDPVLRVSASARESAPQDTRRSEESDL